MRVSFVGEVCTAEYALRGILQAGIRPLDVISTRIEDVLTRSGMEPSYYANLAALCQEEHLQLTLVDDPDEAVELVSAARPDYAFFVGWPYLVRGPILEAIPCIGMHPTRLPERRGGAPLNWTVLDDESESAVSLLRLRREVDAGELLAQHPFSIKPEDYVGDVLQKVCVITEQLVTAVIPKLMRGQATWTEQDDSLATYTRRRTPEDGRIAWADSAARIRNLVRAVSHPFPGAYTILAGRTVEIWRAEIPRGVRIPGRVRPGTIVDVRDDGALVATADNALLLTEVGLPGDCDQPGGMIDGLEALHRHVGAVFDES